MTDAYLNGGNWKEVARTLGIKINTAYKWLEKEQYVPKPKGGSVSKLTPDISAGLTDWIEENASITLEELRVKVHDQFGVTVCKNTIKNWLDGQLFSLKSVRPTVQSMNDPRHKARRAEYVEQLFEHRAEGRTIIWIDETNFNLYCRRREGRSRIGTRASVLTPSSKGSNLHCIGAMSEGQRHRFTTRRGALK